MLMAPISPARIRCLGMGVEPLEPVEDLAPEVPDVTSHAPPGRPGAGLPPLFEGARGDLQKFSELLPGHDLDVVVSHNK